MAKRFLILFAVFSILIQWNAIKPALAETKSFTVFDMRKSLPLHDSDTINYDYYINMGTEDGLKTGDSLAVYRKIPVLDIYRNKAQGDMVVQVAKVKVIHAQANMAVTRMIKGTDKDAPVVEFERVMLGDRVEIATAPSVPAKSEKDDGDDDDDSSSGTAVHSPKTGSAKHINKVLPKKETIKLEAPQSAQATEASVVPVNQMAQ